MIENIIAYLRNVENMRYENDIYEWEKWEHHFSLNHKRCHISFVIDTKNQFCDFYLEIDNAYELIIEKRVGYDEIMHNFNRMIGLSDFLAK